MIFELTIDRLAFGGSGVGRLDGKAVFVPLTAPGDRIRCRIVKDRGRWAEGEMLELLTPAPGRVSPPCPVFGRCGGCQWQHLSYPAQASAKEAIFREQLVRHAAAPAAAVLPVVPAPAPFGYRSRIQLKCRMARDGFVTGFYRRGSHFVIDIEACPLAAPPLNVALGHLRHWLPASPCPERIPQVDLEADDEGGVRLTVHVLEPSACLGEYLAPLAEAAGYSLFLQSGRKDSLLRLVGSGALHISPLASSGMRLAYGAGGFAQVNLEQNRQLVAAVLDAANLRGEERVLDLFCGMGNFSLPLARRAASVIGVEDYAPAIAQAEENARANGIENAAFLSRPAEGALTALAARERFDLVLLDPPRNGAYAVVRELATVRPQCVIYVSCDPSTLARDLVPLLHQGYSLVSARPFDLFPQTHHTESLTVLRCFR